MKERLEKVKNEFIQFLVEFEKFEKTKNLLDSMYFQTFGKLICEDMRLSILLDKYRNAIGMKERGDSDEDIQKMIKVAFTQPDKQYQVLTLKHRNLNNYSPVSDKMTPEYLAEIEDLFERKCKTCHPLIIMNNYQDHERAWKLFVYFYRNNNLEGMRQLVDEISGYTIDESIVGEENLIDFYQKNIEDGKKFMANQVNEYPYTAKAYIEDEMKEAAKAGEYRATINSKKEKVAEMDKRYKEIFGNVEVF